jgi:hypothetical protein
MQTILADDTRDMLEEHKTVASLSNIYDNTPVLTRQSYSATTLQLPMAVPRFARYNITNVDNEESIDDDSKLEDSLHFTNLEDAELPPLTHFDAVSCQIMTYDLLEPRPRTPSLV